MHIISLTILITLQGEEIENGYFGNIAEDKQCECNLLYPKIYIYVNTSKNI